MYCGLYKRVVYYRAVHPIVRMYQVYILTCADTSLYTGITNNLARRLAQHKKGTASRYTSAKQVVKFVYTEKHPDRSSALKREAEIKSWRRSKKLALIKTGL